MASFEEHIAAAEALLAKVVGIPDHAEISVRKAAVHVQIAMALNQKEAMAMTMATMQKATDAMEKI